MTKSIRLVLSDIDGTIFNTDHQVDSDLREIVVLLKEENIPFVLASARSPHGMFPIAEMLDLDKKLITCYNGALIIEGDKEDYRTSA